MCGIVGVVAPGRLRDRDRDAVRAMASTIVHRGPDDEGFFDADDLVLGMRRLAIIDLAGAQQPITSACGNVVVVCNGEIYNFKELRQRMQAKGHVFSTDGDVEAIVYLYLEYGDDFVQHLDGMFAIALWDKRRERMLLVRDHMGIKPVYYAAWQNGVAFASEAKALFELDGLSASVSSRGLKDYLSLGYCVAPHTIFEGVRKLPPASMLVYEQGAYRVRRYWDLPNETEQGVAEPEWIDRIQSELDRAIRAQMVSDVPIGAFLSGGIDSSAIVATMAEHSSAPINTYSIGYSGGATEAYYNELSYAAQVAQQFSTNHNEIAVKPDVAELLPALLWHLEEPISDSAITTTHLVSELAAKTVTVILSGVGGDELFAGYNRYLGSHYLSKYQRVPSWIRRGVLTPVARRLPSSRQSRIQDLMRYAREFMLSADLPWDQRYKAYLAIQSEASLQSMMLDPVSEPDGLDRILGEQTADDDLLRLMRVDCETQMAEDLLLLTDKMTMGQSIECRVPFLDKGLAELAARIPAHQKCPGKELKSLLKQALRQRLPDDILYRRKRGFGAPVGSWFKSQLLPLRNALLSRSVNDSRGVLSADAVEQICRAHDAGKEDNTDLILVLMNLEIWFRIFVDARSPADISVELKELGVASAA
ncbi:MAG: asparagine synthase (glutamine-hydrolyzing) [Pseudomonadota bacterium]